MLRFLAGSRLAINPNLNFEMVLIKNRSAMQVKSRSFGAGNPGPLTSEADICRQKAQTSMAEGRTLR
jgi:hypothetical protein